MYTKHLYTLLTAALVFFQLSAAAQNVSSDELLKQALNETNVNKNYQRAISITQQGLKISPDYADLRILLGRLYLLTGRYEEGVTEIKQALARNPVNKDALNHLINAAIENSKYDDALFYSSRYLENFRSDQGAVIKRADLLKKMGRFDEAVQVSGQLLDRAPGDSTFLYLYKDIQFAQAAYQKDKGDTSKALLSYEAILARDQADTIARNQVININLENGNYLSALDYINSGLPYYKDRSSVMLKKLASLQSAGELNQAYHLSDSMVKAGNADSRIDAIRNEMFVLTRQNRVGLGTSLTFFDQRDRDPWSVHSFSYMRQEKRISLLGRINYADRVSRSGYQYELEAYPKHGGSYSFVSLAYSESFVFPRFKFSYSYFLPLAKSWESELGFRYLNAGSDFRGFTAALGRYFNKYWVNFKTFQTFSEGRFIGSYITSGRYYVKDNADDYLTAIAGYGFSPEDVARNFDFAEWVNLESLRFTLGCQKTIFRRGILGVFATWNKQEYTPGKKRNEFDVSVSFQHKF